MIVYILLYNLKQSNNKEDGPMTQNWKKLLSLLLVLTMLVGMMPAVFAAEEEPAAAPEQAEEILTEEPAEPEVPAEPENC